jgi:hypothetical protein
LQDYQIFFGKCNAMVLTDKFGISRGENPTVIVISLFWC